jgi:hypothetical protein
MPPKTHENAVDDELVDREGRRPRRLPREQGQSIGADLRRQVEEQRRDRAERAE